MCSQLFSSEPFPNRWWLTSAPLFLLDSKICIWWPWESPFLWCVHEPRPEWCACKSIRIWRESVSPTKHPLYSTRYACRHHNAPADRNQLDIQRLFPFPSHAHCRRVEHSFAPQFCPKTKFTWTECKKKWKNIEIHRRGCATTMLQYLPLARASSKIYCGTCVVLPQPVEPCSTTTVLQ